MPKEAHLVEKVSAKHTRRHDTHMHGSRLQQSPPLTLLPRGLMQHVCNERGGVAPRPPPKHHALEQRVAAQPVGAVQATRHLQGMGDGKSGGSERACSC